MKDFCPPNHLIIMGADRHLLNVGSMNRSHPAQAWISCLELIVDLHRDDIKVHSLSFVSDLALRNATGEDSDCQTMRQTELDHPNQTEMVTARTNANHSPTE
jgi:hypothetical protein